MNKNLFYYSIRINCYTIIGVLIIFIVIYLIYSKKNVFEKFEDPVPEWFTKRANIDVTTPAYNKLIAMPNLQLWLDGANTTDITVTNGVFKWMDRSKKARVGLVNKSKQTPPSIVYKGVYFTYNSSTNNGLYVQIPSGTFANGATIFIVAKTESSSQADESLFSRGTNWMAAPFTMKGTDRAVGDGSKWVIYEGSFNLGINGIPTNFLSSHKISTTVWKEYLNDNQIMEFTGRSNIKNQDNSNQVNTNTNFYYEDKAESFFIGTNDNSSTGFNGTVYEVLVFNNVLSDDDYNFITNYLMIKWNINQNYSNLYGNSTTLQTQLTDANNKLNTYNTTSTTLQTQLIDANNKLNTCNTTSTTLQTQLTDANNKCSTSVSNTFAPGPVSAYNTADLQKQLIDANNNFSICTTSLANLQKQLTDTNNSYLEQIYDLSQGLFDCQGTFLESTDADDLNYKITQLTSELNKYKSPSPVSTSTTCNFITICKMKYKSNFNYTQIGCSDTNPLEQFIQVVKDQNEAIDVARIYGATVFTITPANELYIGFTYDVQSITSLNSCKNKTNKIYCTTSTIQTNPTFYGYPYLCSYKTNSASSNPNAKDFKNAVNTIFNNLDSKYNVGKVENLDQAKALANKYGATAFYVDIDLNLYITYNFNKSLIKSTIASKKYSSTINQTIYYAGIRTKKIQLTHKICA